jgi:AmmeMemoRadiSam system protein A
MIHPETSDPLGDALLTLARDAITAHFGGCAHPHSAVPDLDRPGACFVTLTDRKGELRGCIGSLHAHRPLRDDVRENAIAAAFRDPRFPPLKQSELAETRVEVSLLTPPEPLPVVNEEDARHRLRPGQDGVIFAYGGRRATFLPQVWESLPSPGLFLARLKQKAGFAADFWSPEVVLERYAVRKWKEP